MLLLIYLLLIAPAQAFDTVSDRFDVTLHSGTILKAHVKKPVPLQSKLKGKTLPVVLVFGGFQEAAKVVDLIKPGMPALIAGFDYPFEPERKFHFPESLKYAPQAKKMLHETVQGISALLTEMKKRYDVDDDRVTIIGASVGAPFAVLAASQDPRFQGLVLIHGFGAIPQTVAHQLSRKWKPLYGIIAEPIALALSWCAWLYVDIDSPEQAARRMREHQKVLMIAAERDTFIPTSSRESLWRALQSSQARVEQTFTKGDHLQPGAQALLDDLTSQVMVWLGQMRLL